MNTISMLIVAMLVEQQAQLQPKSVGMLNDHVWRIGDLVDLDEFRIERAQPLELVIPEPVQTNRAITDRGLMIEGQLYCIRIVVPDSTHTMPLASGGNTAPMPMWPQDLEAETSQESEVTIWDMVHKLNQLDEDANR